MADVGPTKQIGIIMKKNLITLSLCLAGYHTAQACSYYIDKAKKSNELQKVVLASLGEVRIQSVSVKDFSFFESKPTPMCPEEMTYNATVAVTYKPANQNSSELCSGDITIKKIEPWTKSGVDTYSVSGKKAVVCVEE